MCSVLQTNRYIRKKLKLWVYFYAINMIQLVSIFSQIYHMQVSFSISFIFNLQVYSDLSVDYLKMFLLNVPAAVVALGL